MLHTIERLKGPGRPGFLRRFLRRAHESADGHWRARAEEGSIGPPSVIDLRGDIPAAQWRAAVSGRLERLETGMSLVAETMRRAFAQVFRSIEDAPGERSGPGQELDRVVEDSLATLKAAVEDLAESIHQVPYILAAAADDINARIEVAPTVDPGEGSPLQPVQPVQPVQPLQALQALIPMREPSSPPESIPATPFELEPVDEQFDPMDEDPAGLDARRTWGLEA